jgi:hypothetical protein
MKSSLNLFKAVPITGKTVVSKEQFAELNNGFIKSGFVFSPGVLAEYTGAALDKLVRK